MAETSAERFARFMPLNDKIWGAGNWMTCYREPPCVDGEGEPSFHHIDAHRSESGAGQASPDSAAHSCTAPNDALAATGTGSYWPDSTLPAERGNWSETTPSLPSERHR